MRVRYRPIKPRPRAAIESEQPHNTAIARSIVQWLEAIAAPATVLTGWFFWFGYCYSNARALYFGMDSGSLGLSTNDYIIQSLNPVVTPVVNVLLLVIVLLAAHGFISRTVRKGDEYDVLRDVFRTAAVIGAAFAAMGLLGVYSSVYVQQRYLLLPLFLGGGVALIAYSMSVLRVLRYGYEPASIWFRWAQVTAAIIVVVSLFWATSVYASELGRKSGESLAAERLSMPVVTIYSKTSMSFDSGVTETIVAPLSDSQAAYHYRYSGHYLLARSSGKYFLLSPDWNPILGPTVVLEDRPDIRIELGPINLPMIPTDD